MAKKKQRHHCILSLMVIAINLIVPFQSQSQSENQQIYYKRRYYNSIWDLPISISNDEENHIDSSYFNTRSFGSQGNTQVDLFAIPLPGDAPSPRFSKYTKTKRVMSRALGGNYVEEHLFNINSLLDGNCGADTPLGKNQKRMTLGEMCSLPPDRGTGHRKDIVRVYYNPIVRQCLPFSWSGVGGNANRFVSIKNCYEVCHPSDPGLRKCNAFGSRPYLSSRRSPIQICVKKTEKTKKDLKPVSDVIIRQIPNPTDQSKVLTLIQPVQYQEATLQPEVTKTVIPSVADVPEVFIEKRIYHGSVLIPPSTPMMSPCEAKRQEPYKRSIDVFGSTYPTSNMLAGPRIVGESQNRSFYYQLINK